jgi:hypothetical protein
MTLTLMASSISPWGALSNEALLYQMNVRSHFLRENQSK